VVFSKLSPFSASYIPGVLLMLTGTQSPKAEEVSSMGQLQGVRSPLWAQITSVEDYRAPQPMRLTQPCLAQ
jgi:hypothetical protein